MRFRFPQGGPSTYVVVRKTAEAAFSNRDGARLEYFNSKYWLLGGWQVEPNGWSATNRVTNEVWSSPDLVTWTLELAHDDAPAAGRWNPRHTHMTCVFNGKLWVLGADQYDPGGSLPSTSTDPIDSSVWSSVDGTTWVQEAASSQLSTWWGHDRGVWDAILGVHNGYMHMIGGLRAPDGVSVRTAWPSSSEHWRSADGVTWTRLADVPFSRARASKALSVGGRLVVIGGLSTPPSEAAVAMRDVWTWDGSTWTRTSDGSSAPFEGRSWLAVEAYEGKIWVLTGWDDAATLNQGSAYYSTNFGATWTELPAGTVGYPPSHADGIIATASGIAIAGGFREGKNTWLLSRGAPGAVDYPGTLPLSGWWRDYAGAPWLGSYSDAGSGGNHLTEATNPPTVGATLNGHTTANLDGTNDKLTGPAVANGSLLGASFSIWWLFKADAAVADPGAAFPYNAPGIDDTSGSGLAIGFCAAGVRAGYFDGTNWNSVAQAASTGAWHLARIRSDGTKIELSVDSNAWTSVARAAPLGSLSALLRIGTAYNGTFFDGLIAEVGTADSALTNEQFDAVKAYVNSHYGLSL